MSGLFHPLPTPNDLAFLAMTHYRLGQSEQASAALARLRDRMREPDYANDAECQSFLREATDVVEGTMPKADP